MAAVLVHIDLIGDRPHPSSMVALAAGRLVASSWGATLYAALIVRDPGDRNPASVPAIAAIEAELGRGGADKVVVAFSAGPVAPLWAVVGAAWQGALDHLRPRLVLFGADSPSAPELAPRTGARIGARLLLRARAFGLDDVELRDRDGGYARASDSGAAVAMIGSAAAPRGPESDDDIDLIVLASSGASDARVELAGTSANDLASSANVVVAVGDDVAGDAQIAANARRLAGALGGQVLGGDRTAIAPELCIAIGAPRADIAGAARLIQIAPPRAKHADGILTGSAAGGLADLLKRLETT